MTTPLHSTTAPRLVLLALAALALGPLARGGVDVGRIGAQLGSGAFWQALSGPLVAGAVLLFLRRDREEWTVTAELLAFCAVAALVPAAYVAAGGHDLNDAGKRMVPLALHAAITVFVFRALAADPALASRLRTRSVGLALLATLFGFGLGSAGGLPRLAGPALGLDLLRALARVLPLGTRVGRGSAATQILEEALALAVVVALLAR